MTPLHDSAMRFGAAPNLAALNTDPHGHAAGTYVGLSIAVNKLRDLIGALPECAAKASLRGIEVALEVHPDGDAPGNLVRMSRIVRSWRQADPLSRLEAELDQILEGYGGADECGGAAAERLPQSAAGRSAFR